jgi:hypothetical protein
MGLTHHRLTWIARQNPRIKYATLVAEAHIGPISRSTIYRAFKKLNITRWRAKRCPKLTTAVARLRLRFASDPSWRTHSWDGVGSFSAQNPVIKFSDDSMSAALSENAAASRYGFSVHQSRSETRIWWKRRRQTRVWLKCFGEQSG